MKFDKKFAWRQVKIFCKDHWIAIAATFGVLILIALSVVGFMGMESFYRKMQLAQMPVTILIYLVAAVISAIIYVKIMFGQFGAMKYQKVTGASQNVKFSEVLGIDEVKDEAMEIVHLLRDHAKLKKIGGKIIKGLLMIGPPGCGKTYLAKAIATEAGIPFFSLAGSEFTEIFVGVGASRVRQLFKQARRAAYAQGGAIIFIDELDAIGRGRQFSMLGGQETNSTLNQLLVAMDGIQNEHENVVVIGATNSPEETLDIALLRPGRFDRKIYIERPTLLGREQIFKYYLSKVQFDPSIDIGRLARKAVFKTPAEIENIVKESSLICIRDEREIVTYKDLSEAMDRVDLGVKHRKHMTPEEQKLVAYHEAGHLITLYLLHPTDDVFKASIISRRGSLGLVHHQPREELFTHSKLKLLADIKVSMSGYVSEKLKFNTTSTGVASDFQNAMLVAHQMVWRLGMGEKHLGDFASIPQEQLSEDVKKELNAETEKILRACTAEVEELLTKEMSLLDRFAKELLEKEELEYDDIDAIFKEYDKSKFSPKSN